MTYVWILHENRNYATIARTFPFKVHSTFMTTLEQAAEKLDFKRILPILVIVLVDLMGLSIIIPLMPLFAARFGATHVVNVGERGLGEAAVGLRRWTRPRVPASRQGHP